MAGIIRFDQLRISTTVENAALEGYTDGTIGESSVRVAVDGSTLTRTASGIGVPNGGITGTQLATSVAGAGLTGGGGSALAVGAGTGVTVNTDDVAINTTSTVTFGAGAVWDFSAGTLRAATPVGSTDVATKGYADNIAAGLIVKGAVRAATADVLPAVTYDNGASGIGATLTADANGELTAQDGVALILNDRLLVKNQAAELQNGIYDVTDLGDAGSPFILTRSTDFDNSPSGEVVGGSFTFVQEGTASADSGWVLTTDGAITVGTTALAFTQFSGAGQIAAGDGLAKSGNTLSVNVDGTTLEINTDALRIAATAAGAGLTGGGGGALAVGAGNGITVNTDDVAANLEAAGANAGGLSFNGTAIRVNVDTSSTGSTASVVALSANGVGVRVDNSTIEGSAAGGSLRVKDLGITTGKIAADNVTIATLGVSFREEIVLAAAFTFTSASSYTLAKVALTGVKVDQYHQCYRNGVADMTNVGTGASPSTASEFRITGTALEIGTDITGSGNTYKVRYISADLTA